MDYTDSSGKEVKYNQTEKIALAICALVLFVLFFVTLLQPDKGPGMLQKQLSDRGISTEGITFTRTENKWQNTYRSSAPIDIGEGNWIEYWTFSNVSFSLCLPEWKVFPLPAGEWREPVNVQITLSSEENRKLLEEAGEVPLETYIKDILMEEENK